MTSFDTAQIFRNYQKRDPEKDQSLYSPFRFEVTFDRTCRILTLMNLLKKRGICSLKHMNILEIGCGTGSNILDLINLGAQPHCITVNDLLPERITQASQRLPQAVRIMEGDITMLTFPDSTFHLILLFTVFSSLLDNSFQEKVADLAWSWLQPGGFIVCYDFCYNNPSNPDVQAVPFSRVRSLFPQGTYASEKLTLAPPLSRRLAPLSPTLHRAIYSLFPLLRTHRMTLIQKSL